MAYTTSFLVKNQAMGNSYMHFVRVTADAASGAFATGFGVVDSIMHSPQSATTAGYRVFMNANSALTANPGSVAVSGAANGDVLFFHIFGH